MKYADGQEVKLGDTVSPGDPVGQVVCCIDRDEYTPEFSKAHWADMKRGALFRFSMFGLIHYEEAAERDLQLVGRKT
jgi:hypothetical protein